MDAPVERTADVTVAFQKTVNEDPAILYARLRETCPVAFQTSDSGRRGEAWLVTRHEDIVAVARDTETYTQSIRWPGRRRPPLESNPPEHRQFRALMQPFFMPAALARFEAVSRQIVVPLVETLLEAEGGDFAHGLARPLPPQVLLARLGQPLEDWARIKTCCEASFLQGSTDQADLATYNEANDYLWDYSRAAVADRKADPRDPKEDVIAALLAGEIDGSPVDEALVVGMVRLVLAAGHDSTTSAVGSCLRFLAENPAAQAALRADPSRIPVAIEEILRLRAPVLQMPRRAARDVELGGREIREGDNVLLVFASGNRDEAAFEQPDECVLDRFPNRHLSFGTGVHICIGNGLARQEMKVALEEVLARTDAFGLAEEPEREFWHPYGAVTLKLWTKRQASAKSP